MKILKADFKLAFKICTDFNKKEQICKVRKEIRGGTQKSHLWFHPAESFFHTCWGEEMENNMTDCEEGEGGPTSQGEWRNRSWTDVRRTCVTEPCCGRISLSLKSCFCVSVVDYLDKIQILDTQARVGLFYFL